MIQLIVWWIVWVCNVGDWFCLLHRIALCINKFKRYKVSCITQSFRVMQFNSPYNPIRCMKINVVFLSSSSPLKIVILFQFRAKWLRLQEAFSS